MSYDKPKLTKKEKENRYKYLIALLYGGNHTKFNEEPYNGYYIGLENEPEVLMYKKYLAMSDTEKNDLNLKWKNYYKDSWKSHEAERYRQISIAFGLGDFSCIKELNSEEVKAKPNIKKTSSISPEDLARDPNVRKYYRVKELLQELDSENLNFDLVERANEIFNNKS